MMTRFIGCTAIGLCLVAGVVRAQTAREAPAARPAAAAPAMDEKTTATICSYGIGRKMGADLKNDGVEISLEAFVQGLQDGMQGKESKYTPEQLRAAFSVFQKALQAKQEARDHSAGGQNQREGEAFLANNKKKPGVTTTASGLQYEVVRAGKGASPKATDTVKVHYEGTLISGKVFDSSIKRNEPAEFPVNRVIAGWTEALQLMKVGDKWRVYIPSNLAYGAQGAGADIGPNATLIFDVELLDILPSR